MRVSLGFTDKVRCLSVLRLKQTRYFELYTSCRVLFTHGRIGMTFFIKLHITFCKVTEFLETCKPETCGRVAQPIS